MTAKRLWNTPGRTNGTHLVNHGHDKSCPYLEKTAPGNFCRGPLIWSRGYFIQFQIATVFPSARA